MKPYVIESVGYEQLCVGKEDGSEASVNIINTSLK